ncbi:hypothetical protein [Kitasatospora sp. NBC_01302]|uniref:hypothetical protein n=1 Tax=Kitasatospora sp. NBC_01302 TaxID=2903575 RepID=UPI002E0DD42D|nr:hypothetical protein OG294_14005 [Kitasatospora sp. NBC_01302]
MSSAERDSVAAEFIARMQSRDPDDLEADRQAAWTGDEPPKPIRYNITEHKPHGENTVIYEVRRGHTKAFTLRIETHPRALHDTWPLRREIANHAGVDPDEVLPQWDKDRQRRQMGRFAPALWLIHPNRDENSL